MSGDVEKDEFEKVLSHTPMRDYRICVRLKSYPLQFGYAAEVNTHLFGVVKTHYTSDAATR